MLENWAIYVDGYFIVTTNKIEDDLILGTKTIEASFTQLKKLFLGKIAINQNEKFIIESINAVEGGVRVKIKDKNGLVIEVFDKKRSKVLNVEDCERWFGNVAL